MQRASLSPQHFRPGPIGVRRAGLRALLAVVSLAFLAQSARPLAAYDVLPMDKRLQAQQLIVAKILTGREPLAGKEKLFDDFFGKFIFPAMTQPENQSTIPELRQAFLNRYANAARDPAALARLNNMAIAACSAFIRGNYHPALKYNAVLLLGDLNLRPPIEVGADKQRPQPLPAALPLLLGIAKSAKAPDLLKAGALVGLQRHAAEGIRDAEQLEQVSQLALALATAKEPPAVRDPAAHLWLRRRGVEILGKIGSPGDGRAVFNAVAGLLVDPESPLPLRCAIARSLGGYKFAANDPFDPTRLVGVLGSLSVTICQHELAYAAALQDYPSQRRVTERMQSVAAGLKAAGALAKQPEPQKLAADVAERIDKQIAWLADKEMSDETLDLELQRRCDLLEDDLKELIVVEAAPVPAEVPAADAGRKRAGAVPGAGQPAAGPPAEEDDPFAE